MEAPTQTNILGASLLFATILFLLKKGYDYKMTPGSVKKINSLHPKLRPYAAALLNEAKKNGIELIITDATRTNAEQQKIYEQGRTKPGKIVTNAKPGQSLHNYGLAFDVAPVVNGKVTYDYDWKKIGEIGKKVGLFWGGDFVSFKDNPHFEHKFGNSLATLQKKAALKDTDSNGFVNIA